jgi:NAD(P)H dehydrogenase (quinone)
MSEGISSGRRHCLIVSCHPLADSLCNHLVSRVSKAFTGADIEIEHLDLYESDFVAPLSAAERQGYHAGEFDSSALTEEIAALQRAEILVLIFPTWWFGMPALLKGWFDRVWAPGVAFDQPRKVGERITPKLDGLKQCLVITTLGSPWWVDRLVVRRPLKRILKWALIGVCAPTARFEMLSVYSAMALDQRRLNRFLRRIDNAVKSIVQRCSP